MSDQSAIRHILDHCLIIEEYFGNVNVRTWTIL